MLSQTHTHSKPSEVYHNARDHRQCSHQIGIRDVPSLDNLHGGVGYSQLVVNLSQKPVDSSHTLSLLHQIVQTRFPIGNEIVHHILALVPRLGLVCQVAHVPFAGGGKFFALPPPCQQFVPFLLLPHVGVDHAIVVLPLSPDPVGFDLEFLYFALPDLPLRRSFPQDQLVHELELSGQFVQGQEEFRGGKNSILHLGELLAGVIREFATFGKQFGNGGHIVVVQMNAVDWVGSIRMVLLS